MTRDEAYLAARKNIAQQHISGEDKTNNKKQGIMSGKFFKECGSVNNFVQTAFLPISISRHSVTK